MIDWHSHILPGMDDGSRDPEESAAMLDMERSQGISTVVATPHFYANDESVSSFLDRREKAYRLLEQKCADRLPHIRLGAEVRYYPGISRLPGLKELRIQGSKLLLLEMPTTRWTETTIRELVELSGKGGLKLVLAHVERYQDLQKPDNLIRLYENGVLMQVNASYFNSFSTKRKAITYLTEGRIHFVGSDCHNMKSRPPKLGEAFSYIWKKLGDEYVSQMNEFGYSLLEANSK